MRVKSSIKNATFAIAGQLVGVISSFVCRTIFINILGTNYLGISGLFSNILSLLSLTELGIGSVIIYSLYKPLAQDDEHKIKALMNFYATAYKIVGCIVALLGLLLVPFMKYLIKNPPEIPYLTLIYLMYVFNSSITYFYSYKRSIITADQKEYINTIYMYTFILIQNILQIFILITTRNFIVYLSIQIITNFLTNVFISKKADKLYPFLKNGRKEYLCKDDRKNIFKNTYAMMLHTMGAVVLNGTDNIIISSFVGVFWVGLYSNYKMLIGIVSSFVAMLFQSTTASIGNLTATETDSKSYDIFNVYMLSCCWLYGFCAICFWILFEPFITIWIGHEYVLNKYITLVVISNFFIAGMRKPLMTFRTTYGLFYKDRYKPIFECSINLLFSIILVQKIGIAGVFLGTLISAVTTTIWIEPYILFKYGFHKPLHLFFLAYGKYIFATIVTALFTQLVCSVFTQSTIMALIIKTVICLVVPNTAFILLFYRKKEFKYLYMVSSGIVKKSLRWDWIRKYKGLIDGLWEGK